jgi:hypothetical protein
VKFTKPGRGKVAKSRDIPQWGEVDAQMFDGLERLEPCERPHLRPILETETHELGVPSEWSQVDF